MSHHLIYDRKARGILLLRLAENVAILAPIIFLYCKHGCLTAVLLPGEGNQDFGMWQTTFTRDYVAIISLFPTTVQVRIYIFSATLRDYVWAQP